MKILKENYKWIIVVILIVLMGVLILFQVKKSLRDENVFIISESIKVENYTEFAGAKKYTEIILQEILDIDSVEVNIYNSPIEFELENIILQGYILQNPFANMYNIYITKAFRKHYLTVFLSHELIHLQQMHEGRLVHLDSVTIIWEGKDTINYLEIDYNDRPNEIEAFEKEWEVRKKLRDLLYEDLTN